MPGRDRKGPESQGPATGRGLGSCTGVNAPMADGAYGRGYGYGRRRRARYRVVDVDYARNTSAERKRMLEEQKKAIEKELEALEDENDETE